MATITRYPFTRHLRAVPTSHVLHLRAGTLKHDGAGIAFWYRPLSAVISEVPVDDRELPFVAHARTADFQDVAVQLTVSYRFDDPRLVASRLDFSIDPDHGRWTGNPLEQVAHLLGELATAQVIDAIAEMTVQDAVTAGVGALRRRVTDGLRVDERLASTGIAVLGARVGSVRAEADMEKYLQTPAREQAQGEADKSTFERRALAVERERAIAENELANRIQLALREQELVAQDGANARTRADEAAAAALIEANAAAERQTLRAEADAHTARVVGEAQGAAEAARLAAYDGVDREVLTALAMRELAANLPSIGNLTVTPDLLTGALAGLVGGKEA
ncbi:SPFH domain-containing protein [Cellulomonas sp. JH27-2]|uniref:SPFH domain-containing protein n=1 Tax=Cellulomonas sp. JH27-2 TaxID=2774139 RepID=UPI001784A579|nr:SPFH domain-containing protein [Cellulomonas sp. JH27-2]MBD8058800.1 SPFH domain-containing protein [Cellulomonas sp. JH27-2]